MMINVDYRRLRKNPAFKATTRDPLVIVGYGSFSCSYFSASADRRTGRKTGV
jgi:hypothetical protein